ncbi:hypothetical protein G5714_022013 [Onychostoma macrolepis]|uniref:Uncharacterized protein n=1 Tax=Onychostoma macrolepis TaxID=369639 RepID=A0A7J6BUM0_9TELE|nr:hypothetical protein G5714_022013 [Onychostoma macrolepis]
MTSVSIRECDDYDMTSHVEEEEEEDEEAVRRKKSKRNFDDYVLESEDLEEEEENMTDAIIKVPSFPIPPSKTLDTQIYETGVGSRDRSTGNPGHLNVNRVSQLKGAGSSHQSSHSDVSHHSKRYRHRKQSRHSDWSRDSNQMQQGSLPTG